MITFARSDYGLLNEKGYPHYGIIVCVRPSGNFKTRADKISKINKIAADIDRKLRQKSGSIDGEIIKIHAN